MAYGRLSVSEGWCFADMHEREGCAEVRFRSFEKEIRKVDNMAYRITLTEQSSTNTAFSIRTCRRFSANGPAT
ncbi:hypothetical protein [Sinorhizobium meliloti]|uniref:hypothetical protein n=1 Tax=Rhizobium meliloti TaxID=382 RepID=UPI000FDC60CB|nr:hypothetical protein [Sinorhizobium meliloti]MDE3812210.1 hypothetical protein [Sinorhizobium meliloti]RVH43145.1 hypothetical protein CN212_27335 [Sinorhizobium meliloti]